MVGQKYKFKVKPYPGILQALGLLVLLFAVSLVVAIPIEIAGRTMHTGLHDVAFIGNFSAQL
jgi:hypothetical protein